MSKPLVILLALAVLAGGAALVARVTGHGDLPVASANKGTAKTSLVPHSSSSMLSPSKSGPPQNRHLSHDGVTAAELDAVLAALHQPDKLSRLQELAAGGNGSAAVAVGRSLLDCTPRALEINRRHVQQLQSQAEQLKLRLLGGADSAPAPAASAETLAAQIASVEVEVDLRDEAPETCEQPEFSQPWSGFAWIARAADMGHKQARVVFVDKVVEFFGRPRQVARYPERAIALRNQARIYLEQVKAECTPQSLRTYLWWSVALYAMDVEQRYSTVFLWKRLSQKLFGGGADSRWGEYQEAELERLITPQQKQRAEQRIEALLDRCGGDA